MHSLQIHASSHRRLACTKRFYVGSITSRSSGNEPAAPPRRDGWTRGFAIVDLHQPEGRLLKSSRHKLFFFQSRFSNGGVEGAEGVV